MVAARLGKGGYVKQLGGYKTKADDTRPRYVSWAIFEIRWGETKNRHTNETETLTRGKTSMCRVCVYHV